MLQEAYNYVTRVQLEEKDDGAKFSLRISKDIHLCRNVFRKADVVNYFLYGFKPAVRELLAQNLMTMAPSPCPSMDAHVNHV